MDVTEIEKQVISLFGEISEAFHLDSEKLLVIGCSTSEINGRQIGKAGSEETARAVFEGIEKVRERYGFSMAVQCCEHINRALITERAVMLTRGLSQVSVRPVPEAGGALPAYVYSRLKEPVVVETVAADAGVDIGDTFIGMHLKRVAVPFRTQIKEIGKAHVTAAYTRPKLIGGPRAKY